MSKPIAGVARTREILKTYDLHAKKGFGQNFLTDVSVVARCAEMSHCEGAVIEVGPGIGALTQQLAERSKHVLAFEVDERLPEVLADTLSDYDNVEIRLQDFLTAPVHDIAEELKKEYGTVSVAANLPYYITTPVLFKIFEEGDAIDWITVMVQKEVADRFAAPVNSADYGALSVECQYLFKVEKLFNVSRNCFNPAPNVDSAIVRFERRKDRAELDTTAFFELIKACFKQRRKTLYNNLKEYLGSAEAATALIEKAGLVPTMRAQECTIEDFLKLQEARG